MATSRTWLLRNRILPGGEEKETEKKKIKMREEGEGERGEMEEVKD